MKINVTVDLPTGDLCYTDKDVCRFYSAGAKDHWCGLFDRHLECIKAGTVLTCSQIKKCTPCIEAMQAQLDREKETERDDLIGALCRCVKLVYIDAYVAGQEGAEIFDDGLDADIYLGLKAVFDKYGELPTQPMPDGWISYTTGAYMGCDESGEPKWADRKFYRCPRCRKGTAVQTNYCPNCGVRLSKTEPPREKRV